MFLLLTLFILLICAACGIIPACFTWSKHKVISVIAIMAGITPGLGILILSMSQLELLFWVSIISPPVLFILCGVYYFKHIIHSDKNQIAFLLCLSGFMMTAIWGLIYYQLMLGIGV